MTNNMLRWAKRIDHTQLSPTATKEDIRLAANIAQHYSTASLCIAPVYVSFASSLLKASDIRVCTVIGFPHGNVPIQIKLAECVRAIADGADEIDAVLQLGAVNAWQEEVIRDEINALRALTHRHNRVLKIIIETDYIHKVDKLERLTQMCIASSCDFIKTSTGFSFQKNSEGQYVVKGAKLEDISVLSRTANGQIGIKASGGIRSFNRMKALWEKGATRFGMSATVKVLQQLELSTKDPQN